MTARLTLALALMLAEPAFAGKRGEPALVEDARAFAATDRSKAIRLLEDAIDNESSLNARDRAVVMLNAGEQRRIHGDRQKAAAWFVEAQTAATDTDVAEAARLGALLVEMQHPIDAKTKKDLEQLALRSALTTQNADRWYWLAVDAAFANDVGAVKDYTRKALSAAEADASVSGRIRADLDALSTGATPKPPEAPRPTLDRAREALKAGQRDEAAALTRQILGSNTASLYEMDVAKYIQRFAETGIASDPLKVGLLLPLTGKYAAVGKQIRDAIEFGFHQEKGPGSLVFEDAGDTPETVLKGLEKLVFVDSVSAIIGPLRNEGTLEAKRAAEAIGIPLVTLSQGAESEGPSDWVFKGMPTVRDQVAALLDHAMTVAGLRTFGVFAPDTAYGHLAATEFRAAVERRGGTIWRETFYGADATDLIPFAKTYGGTELATRQATLTRLRAGASRAGQRGSRVVLDPQPFDAIFVPDNAQRVPIACAALAYVEYPIGGFQTVNEPKKVPLLGLSGWNNEGLVDRGGLYIQNSFFTDFWYDDDADGQAFIEKYKIVTSRIPTPIEAVAYDLGALIGTAARKLNKDKGEFRDAIRNAVRLDSATGTDAFLPPPAAADSESTIPSAAAPARHRLRVLTMEGKAILPAHPPEPEALPDGAAPEFR